jgi:hypothetical protein
MEKIRRRRDFIAIFASAGHRLPFHVSLVWVGQGDPGFWLCMLLAGRSPAAAPNPSGHVMPVTARRFVGATMDRSDPNAMT